MAGMRFSLRTLLIILTLLCVYFAYFHFLSRAALISLACAVLVVPATLAVFPLLDLLVRTVGRFTPDDYRNDA